MNSLLHFYVIACKVKILVTKRLLKSITVVPVIELQTVFVHEGCTSVLYTLSDALYDGRVHLCVLNTVTGECTDAQFETLIVVQLLFLRSCAIVVCTSVQCTSAYVCVEHRQ